MCTHPRNHKMMMKMKAMTGSGTGSGLGSGSGGPGMGGMNPNDMMNHKAECCPLVVNSLALTAFMAALMGGAMLLCTLITMGSVRRRRRSAASSFDWQSIIMDLAHKGREIRPFFLFFFPVKGKLQQLCDKS